MKPQEKQEMDWLIGKNTTEEKEMVNAYILFIFNLFIKVIRVCPELYRFDYIYGKLNLLIL